MMIDHPELDPELDHVLDHVLDDDHDVLRRRDDGGLERQVNGWRGGSFHQYTGADFPLDSIELGIQPIISRRTPRAVTTLSQTTGN